MANAQSCIKYIGLFISINGLFFFISSNEFVAILCGFIAVAIGGIAYLFKNTTSNKVVFLIFGFFSFICLIFLAFHFQDYILKFYLLKWVVVAAFWIATAGTILPFTMSLLKEKKYILGGTYLLLLSAIVVVTALKAPEDFTNQTNNINSSELDLFMISISLIMAGLTLINFSSRLSDFKNIHIVKIILKRKR